MGCIHERDVFFETIQHNAESYRTGNAPKVLQLPETLQKMAEAFGAFHDGLAKALAQETDELQKVGLGTTYYDFDIDPGYDGDDEFSDGDIDCDMFEDSCCTNNACMEYDFNEQFNKKR